MKKNTHWIIILTCGILILYCFLFFVINQDIGVLLAMATLIVTSVSLFVQQKGLITQIRLSVFSDSMHLLMADEKFSESQDYIFSRAFDEDIIVVQQALNIKSQNDVTLDDFRRILHQNRIDGEVVEVNSDTRERLRKSYNKIRYVFSRMEYLGVLSEERGVEALLLDYYGYTILSTYERLMPIIEKTRRDTNSNMLYCHFVNLYNLAEKKRKNSKS
ncbi:MAG: hypothetical protein J6X62_02600 [Bacteroidales bacterium]|nr:hypothetical protein [Bacteroidales bacterium]